MGAQGPEQTMLILKQNQGRLEPGNQVLIQLCSLLAAWPWEGVFASLNYDFLSFKIKA